MRLGDVVAPHCPLARPLCCTLHTSQYCAPPLYHHDWRLSEAALELLTPAPPPAPVEAEAEVEAALLLDAVARRARFTARFPHHSHQAATLSYRRPELSTPHLKSSSASNHFANSSMSLVVVAGDPRFLSFGRCLGFFFSLTETTAADDAMSCQLCVKIFLTSLSRKKTIQEKNQQQSTTLSWTTPH